jgi:hypothetical protein
MHSRGSAGTVSQASGSTGRSTSMLSCCAPPTPPPPTPPPVLQDGTVATLAVLHAVELPAHALVVSDWEDGPHHSPILVVPRSAELQRDEDALGRALVVTVGGTRPVVSTAMVSSLLFERFGLTTQDADVRRHVPEDFIVRFRRPADRDRVLAAGPTGAPLPLIWNPWRRTSLAHSGAFRYRVLVGMRRIPLHAWNVPTVQTVLGPCCSGINIVGPIDVDDDDDRELFATAWCWHPRYTSAASKSSLSPSPSSPERTTSLRRRSAACATSFTSGSTHTRISTLRRHTA